MNTIIIAEAGVNHNGNIEMAKQLIEVASKAGVDFIKFQTFKASSLVTKSAKIAEYQKQNMKVHNDTQYNMLQKLELNETKHKELIRHCDKYNIKFLSTAFDQSSIDLLNKLNIPFFKIPSGELTNKPYLQYIAQKRKPVILSTGMANVEEIKAAVDVLVNQGLDKNMITLLHCNTEYPTPFEDVNLKAMLTLKNKFDINVGYSDHTIGIEIPIAAVALGATVIEKHFTLDRNLPGPDHKASLEPDELISMVKAIRNIEKAISGSGEKIPSSSEQKNIPIARKSIVAACYIKKGETFSPQNLTAKRPGNGISPMYWDDIIGKIANKDFNEDELISL